MLGYLRRLLGHNLHLKLFALFLTLVLFFRATSDQAKEEVEKERKIFNVRVKYHSLSSELVRISPVETVDVEVLGPRDVLNKGKDFLQAEANLANLPAGKHKIDVVVIIKHPKLELLGYVPKVINVELDQIVSEIRKVELFIPIRVAGKNNWVIDPLEVQVSGARSKVESIYQVVAKAPILLPGEKVKVKLQAVNVKDRIMQDVKILPEEIIVQRLLK